MWKDVNTHHFSSSSRPMLINSPVWFVCPTKMADSALWLVKSLKLVKLHVKGQFWLNNSQFYIANLYLAIPIKKIQNCEFMLYNSENKSELPDVNLKKKKVRNVRKCHNYIFFFLFSGANRLPNVCDHPEIFWLQTMGSLLTWTQLKALLALEETHLRNNCGLKRNNSSRESSTQNSL